MKKTFSIEVYKIYDVNLVCDECGEELEVVKVEEPRRETDEHWVYVKPHKCPEEEE